eukprot:TRINITY_DN551_c0_g1_i4.p1 TRINITY_DN551_c0_g1~~TRINITY_DN551_c0_g1_i4.p1  ORF type:complete len:106 (-),score=22.28 TRINITY_DN551_c0_g1_i4:87-404(-)
MLFPRRSQSLPTVSMRKSEAMKNPRKKSANTSPNWFSSDSEKAWAGSGTPASSRPAAAPVTGAAPRREASCTGAMKTGASEAKASTANSARGSTIVLDRDAMTRC